ncbi:transcription elongation factor [Salegentibacter sp. JZCK2]|uniref:transcription elongation factor n=1 Tax=Salegentibacter tibetensis TaxID=2873600 RepID=UPI001CCF2ED3|nr:transcription elongation factor [Salegentibacter tibetensis]MBZ9731660.1 transcription elongation factor [Salegentibacter tibetensis]
MNSIKEKLYKACEAYVEERIKRIEAAMAGLESDLENETKSSAGDKYETGREMINLEINKLSEQLQQFKNLRNTLSVAKRRTNNATAQLGTAVKTNMANYFIAIPANRIIVDGVVYFAIGANSPIAQLLLHKKAGEKITFNGKSAKILEVF